MENNSYEQIWNFCKQMESIQNPFSNSINKIIFSNSKKKNSRKNKEKMEAISEIEQKFNKKSEIINYRIFDDISFVLSVIMRFPIS